MALLIALSLLIAIVGVVLWASGGEIVLEKQGAGIVEAIPDHLAGSFIGPPEVLILFSYELAYGLGDQGARAAQKVEAIYDRLDRVIEEIAASDADVAMLREVDFASNRTGFLPQLHYVAAALGWGYVAAATTWECRYLPLPRSQAGRVRAGQGIISRLPLEHNSWHRLAQSRWGNSRAVAPFAPQDTVQVVDMRCGVRGVRLVQASLAQRHGGWDGRRRDELLAVMRRVAMPSCVVAGVDRQSSGIISSALEFQSREGNILLGTTWSGFEVRLLAPLAGVSEHAPVLVRLSL